MYVVTLKVEDDRLGELITAATPMIAGPVTVQVYIQPVQEEARRRRSGGSVGSAGRTIASPQGRRKGQRMLPHEMRPSVMILDALKTGPCTLQDLIETIGTEGYAPATAKSRISDLRRSSHVVQTIGKGGVASYQLGPNA